EELDGKGVEELVGEDHPADGTGHLMEARVPRDPERLRGEGAFLDPPANGGRLDDAVVQARGGFGMEVVERREDVPGKPRVVGGGFDEVDAVEIGELARAPGCQQESEDRTHADAGIEVTGPADDAFRGLVVAAAGPVQGDLHESLEGHGPAALNLIAEGLL